MMLDTDLDAVAGNIERSRAALDDPAAMADLEAEVHSLIAEATGDRVLQLAREPSGLMIRETIGTSLKPCRRRRAARSKRASHLLDALRRRDREAARQWMQRHIADFAKGLARIGMSLAAPVRVQGWTTRRPAQIGRRTWRAAAMRAAPDNDRGNGFVQGRAIAHTA
jgi:GntR family transcriptional repressor for pyruvate dehydrogenase complex